jgi:putative ABC transport system permease protein
MLHNFILVAIRNLVKQKVYTIINILGLALGITACLLILLYANYELSYDDFNPKSDRIFKMEAERNYSDHTVFFAVVPSSFAGVALRECPEVINTLRILGPFKRRNISYKASESDVRTYQEDYVILSDTSFFSFFNVRLLKGNQKTALAKPNQMVITMATAKKYFGNEDPLNKTLGGDFGDFTITGVCENMPENSHLRFDFIGSLTEQDFPFPGNDFANFGCHTYFELRGSADAAKLEAKFPKMVDRYAGPEIERDLKISWSDYKKKGNGYQYFLKSLRSIHLDPLNLEETATPSGNIKYVYAMIFIALLILIIACINFMNLSTARSSERAREVGVRKVVGSGKNQLITQFLMESVVLSLVSTVIAAFLAWILLPEFNALVDRQLHLTFEPGLIFQLVLMATIVGLLAGLYPAFVLSSYNPVVVMKGNFTGNAKGSWLRNGLVVFQFMISIILIASTTIIKDQIHYMQSKKLGFEKENVLMIERAWELEKKADVFLEEVRKLRDVRGAGGVSSSLGTREVGAIILKPVGSDAVLNVKTLSIDDDFSKTIGFTLVDGRSFSKESIDSSFLLLNETAVKTFGIKNPVGLQLTRTVLPHVWKYTVIGVVKDFHFKSLRDPITPMVIESSERNGGTNYIAVRLSGVNTATAIQKIESLWKQFAPKKSFAYYFLDENMASQYAEEHRSRDLFSAFSMLAILIGCVGLFALSAYTTMLRKKEIGIRKLLGASVRGVIILLSKEFTILVFIAFLLAAPLSWWMMNQWLMEFSYRISFGVGPFVFAGCVALSIALITVSYQSIKAALANPITSLKVE